MNINIFQAMNIGFQIVADVELLQQGLPTNGIKVNNRWYRIVPEADANTKDSLEAKVIKRIPDNAA